MKQISFWKVKLQGEAQEITYKEGESFTGIWKYSLKKSVDKR